MSINTAVAAPATGGVDDTLLESAVRKNIWRIIPFLALAYLVNFLDRTSVGFAGLQMNQAIGLTPTQFGYGAGILFVSYCLLEVPSNLMMYRFGARRWLARIMITWGLAAAATALAVGPNSFYFIRFLLGVFEAGFFPGVIWYISIWFPAKYRTRAMALFIAAAPLSQLVGGPISVTLLQMDGLLGLGGWQWMFILEGIPAVLLGIVCLWLLADEPKDAIWLSGPERDTLIQALASETHERPKKDLWSAMRDPRVLMSALIVFCYTVGSYGLSLWLPLILKGHELSTTAIGWLSAIPFLFATGATLVFARFVDRTGLKIYTLIATLVLGIIGMVMSVYFSSLVAALFWITIGLIGVISARTIFYTIPQLFLTGAAAAGGLAFINSLGAFGGFVGPSMVGWLKDATGSYNAGMLGMAAVLAVAIATSIRLRLAVRNA
jgi:ACS family tartrate transporter-like MFS transporter